MTDRKKLREFLEAVAGNGALDASATSPATVLALLKELDAKDARIEKLRIGLTAIADDVVPALLDELDAKDARIAELANHIVGLSARIDKLRGGIRDVIDENAADWTMALTDLLAADDEAAKG